MVSFPQPWHLTHHKIFSFQLIIPISHSLDIFIKLPLYGVFFSESSENVGCAQSLGLVSITLALCLSFSLSLHAHFWDMGVMIFLC